VLHDGWRVALFRQFRPLAYFAAFSSPDIFACLHLAVSSLIDLGGWQWDILVLTAPNTVALVRSLLAPCNLGERLHIAPVEQSRHRLDWHMAR